MYQFYYFLRRILFTVIANPSCPFTFNASFIMLYIVLFYLFKSIYGMQINIKILGDKVFHCVFREEFLKLTIQLCCKCFIVRYDQGWLSPINKAKTICIWIRVSFDASSNSFTCSKVYVLVSSTIIVWYFDFFTPFDSSKPSQGFVIINLFDNAYLIEVFIIVLALLEIAEYCFTGSLYIFIRYPWLSASSLRPPILGIICFWIQSL